MSEKGYPFLHGVHKKEAVQYLKDIELYEKIVNETTNIFGGHYPKDDGFIMITSANSIWNARQEKNIDVYLKQ